MLFTITSIEPQTKSSRVSIFLNGKFAFGLSYELTVEEGLKVGERLDSQRFDVLIHKDVEDRLFSRACHFLSFRPRSVKEVRDYLGQKVSSGSFIRVGRLPALYQDGSGPAGEAGTPALQSPKGEVGFLFAIQKERTVDYTGNIDQVIRRLGDLKLLDDEAFARWWIQQRQNSSKPKGDYLIRQELLAKGIEDSVAEQALLSSSSTECDRALKAVQKVVPRYQKLPPREFKRKLSDYLRRRGFGWEVINEVIRGLVG